MATELHEILAVETSLEKASANLIEESKKTFGKENLFSGESKTLEMFADSDANLNSTEYRKIETTVADNLDYLVKPIADYWDVVFQKDLANQAAKADIILDGSVIAKDVPATTLLGLESKLSKLRELYLHIPTLEPGIHWEPDATLGKGVYRAVHPVVTFKTKKDVEFRTMAPATDRHPAQIHTQEVTTNTGKYTTVRWSGKVSSADKAAMITRIDSLLKAVKTARTRANKAAVDSSRIIGKSLLNYINNG